MQVKIQLLKGWADYSRDNPEGPPTYLRDLSPTPGPLQVSLMLYTSGELPNPSEQDLVEMCHELGAARGCGKPVDSASGQCAFGKFGTAIFRTTENPRIQIWRLSNGKDFILVTHIFPDEPDATEVQEAEQIVRGLTIEAESKPRWKFW